MAKAKKLPSGSWRCRVYSYKDADGKQHYESFTAPTKAEAEMMAAEYSAGKKRRVRADLTVHEAIDGYIRAKEPVLSPSTIRGYDRMMKTDYQLIGKKKLRTLTSEEVQLFVSDLSRRKSPKSVRNAYGLLSAAAALYAPDLSFRVTLPAKVKKRPASPSDESVLALYEAAYPKLKLCIAFGMCGIRRGEMCALEYSDLKDGMIHINKDMVKARTGEWIIKPRPKTEDSDRYVLLPRFVLRLIGEGSGRILNVTPNTITKQFIKYRGKLGFSFTLHDLRHYFASSAAVLGIPDIYAADMGGWNRGSSAMKSIYQNNIASMSDYYARKLNQHLAEIVKEDA